MSEIDQSSVDDLIKQNEDEYNAVRSGTVEEVVEEGAEEPLDETEESPPGYLNYEEWIAEGKDPDMYRGKKAYQDEYERIQDNKSLKSDLKALQQTTQQIGESLTEWQTKEQDRIRTELEGKLARATEDDDVQGALTAQKELDTLKPVETPKEHPTIQSFRADNPIIDPTSPEFDKEFDKTVENLFNTSAKSLGWETRTASKEEMQRELDFALSQAKLRFPDLFKSPKNARNTPNPSNTRGSEKADPMKRLKNHIIDSKNPRNRTAASELGEFLKGKYGDKFDIDTFADNLER